MELNSDLLARAARVKLLLMDVDGVLTGGRLLWSPDGQGGVVETKAFDSQDGIGLQWLNWYGIATGVISGRNSPSTVERARQCKMKYVYQGHIEKIPILEEILADAGVTGEETGYIGDDFTDIVIMNRVGFAAAPANAREEVKRHAHFIAQHKGGEGAVRDVVEVVLRARGIWPEILRKYEVRDA